MVTMPPHLIMHTPGIQASHFRPLVKPGCNPEPAGIFPIFTVFLCSYDPCTTTEKPQAWHFPLPVMCNWWSTNTCTEYSRVTLLIPCSTTFSMGVTVGSGLHTTG